MSTKKFISCIIPLILLMCICICLLWHILYGSVLKYTHDIYEINVFSHCLTNNSVGDDWSVTYRLNGEVFSEYKKLTVPLNTTPKLNFNVTIREDDAYPDIASKSIQIKLKNDINYSFDVVVYENNGRYKGNTAEWQIKISVNYIGKSNKPIN